MRRSLTVILLAATAALIWWATSGQASPTGQTGPIAPDVSDSVAAGNRQPLHVDVTGRQAVDPAQAVLILGDRDEALEGAVLHRYLERNEGTMELGADPLAVSDTDGRLVHPALAEAAQKFVVNRQGYVPAVIGGGFEGEQTVQLERGSRLTVHVITDTGVALPETRVVLSARVLSTITDLPGDGRGAPLHPRPVWSCSTGPTGAAVLECLPSGRFYVKVFHPLYAALGSIQDSRPVTIDGDVEMTFTMQDMYGVVYECPSPEPVESQAWTWNLTHLDHSYGVVSRLATCRRELRKRFPEAHVFVHRPAFPNEVTEVGCQVILSDGTFWRGSWPLRPLRELIEPVFLEQDVEARYRQVQVELTSKSGRVLEVPLQIAEWMEEYRERPSIWSALPGQPLFLKHGRYVAEPQNAAAWWTTLPEPLLFEVSEALPAGDVVQLRVDEDFVPVRLVPIFPGEALLSPLHINIDDPARNGLSIANWSPERGPIHMLVPAGPILIQTGSAHYESLEFTVEVGVDDIDRQIELRLVERL